MKVLDPKNKDFDYHEDPTHFFEFERFEKMAGDFTLITNNFNFSSSTNFITQQDKVVHLEFEEPNCFCSTAHQSLRTGYEEITHKIFTLCPYTADWLNKKYGNQKRTPIFFPFNEKYVPIKTDKNYDVIYTGNLHGIALCRTAKAISKFNYRLVSQSNSKLVTNYNVSYLDKLDLIARSKIMIVHNLLHLNESHISEIKKIKDYKQNKAFKEINFARYLYSKFTKTEILAPQLKSRLFEAAFCQSLILCRKNPWNLIEKFFQPGKEFIYYEDHELAKTIRKILDDYGSYEKIIKNAYERAMNSYTTTAFFNKFLKDL